MLDMRPRGVGGSSGGGAPFDATYITQTPNVTLTNEQALSLLATGMLKNTTATGILSIGVPTVDFASAAQGALADTSLQPGDIGVTVQAYDLTLDALAAYNTNGLLTQTAVDTFAGRSIAVGAGGFLSVADGNGVAGNPTLDLADAELLALAGLTSAADKLPYFTGLGTAALTDFTAFARTILDDANQGAVQTTLGLVIGTNVQAWDADLDTLAGLSKADSNFIVGDGVAWVVESGATVRTSLGLGTIATINDAPSDGSTYGRNNAAWAVVSAGSTLPVADTQTIVKGSVDATKLLRFEVDGFTAGATRVLTPPNADITIAGTNFANVFTAAQTQQGSGNQYLTIRSTSAQSGLNIISQVSGGGDWLVGTGANANLGEDALYFYSQLSPAGFKLEIDKTGQGFISNTLGVGTATIPTSPLTPSIYAKNTTGNICRIGVTSQANSGFGFYISDVLKWSASTYLPSGTNYSFVFFNEQTNTNTFYLNGDGDCALFGIPGVGGDLSANAKMRVQQPSTTAAIPVLWLKQSDLSEEFIRFESTVGAGNAIDTAALGAYYGKVRVYVEGVGAKWLALYD